MDDKIVRTNEVALDILDQLHSLMFNQAVMFVEMGRLLLIIKEQKLYELMGNGGYESFPMFLANPDIGLKPSTAYAYIKIYKTYIRKLGYSQDEVAEIPFTKLQLLATKVDLEEKEEADEWMQKAKTLGTKDFQTELDEYVGNKGHEDKLPYPEIHRCPACGKWKVTMPEENKCKC